jgi:hypothetical protein
MNSIKKFFWHLSEKIGLGDIGRTAASTHALGVEDYLQKYLYRSEKAADLKWLGSYERQTYSQSGEDGVIEEIFKRIGTTNKQFVEFGVSQGLENNTAYLLLSGWKGVWLEGSAKFFASIQKTFAPLIASGHLTAKNAFITAENIEGLFAETKVPTEPDLLSIDIDGNDYWIWKAIINYRPRVIVIEYNAHLGPTQPLVMPYDPKWVWDRGMHFNSSIKAYEQLGKEKGYSLVYCNIVGNNAFFVRNDLVGDKFSGPFTAENFFQSLKLFLLRPVRYGRTFKLLERAAK